MLRARGLSVQFGQLRALDRVDLDIHAGEIVALAGENGAGKSTLVRCIAGDMAPSGGQVIINGQVLAPEPRAAARLGVAVVWQDLALCENLDVASNLLLGAETRRMMLSSVRLQARAQVFARSDWASPCPAPPPRSATSPAASGSWWPWPEPCGTILASSSWTSRRRLSAWPSRLRWKS